MDRGVGFSDVVGSMMAFITNQGQQRTADEASGRSEREMRLRERDQAIQEEDRPMELEIKKQAMAHQKVVDSMAVRKLEQELVEFGLKKSVNELLVQSNKQQIEINKYKLKDAERRDTKITSFDTEGDEDLVDVSPAGTAPSATPSVVPAKISSGANQFQVTETAKTVNQGLEGAI
jgi:hypothetical protein